MPDANFVDPFDTPIKKALDQRAQDVAAYQAQGSAQRSSFANQLEAKFPRQLPTEPGHTGAFVDPYDKMREPVLPGPKDATSANFGASVKAGFAEDEGTKRRLIAQTLFPGDPKGESRVGFDNGTPVYVDDQGVLRRVSGPLATIGASLVSNSPEAAGATAGTIFGSPVIGTAVGGGIGKLVKRTAMHFIANEPVTPGSMAKEVGTEMAIDATAGLAGKAVTAAGNKGSIVDFSPNNIGQAEAVRNRVLQNTGVNLDLAQASGNRKLIAVRNYLSEHSEGDSADLFQAADEASKGKFQEAANRVLDKVANAAPADALGSNGVNAAKSVIKGVEDKLKADVKPYYDAAGKQRLSADVVDQISKDPVLRDAARRVQASPIYQRDLGIDPELKPVIEGGTKFSQPMAWDAKKGFYPKPTTTTAKDLQVKPDLKPESLAFWHLVKGNLDDQIERYASMPGKANEVRILTGARQSLTQKLEAASPEYAQANAHWAQVQNTVLKPLNDSPIGLLSRITDPKVATAAAKIMQDANVTPAQIFQTRKLLEAQQPDAFNGLVRQWLATKLNKAYTVTQAGDTVNPAGKFMQAVYGSPDAKAKMNAMLGPAAQDFENLMEAAERLAKTRYGGNSNTSQNLRIGDSIKSSGLNLLVNLANRGLQPKETIIKAIDQRALNNGAAEITQALLDPNTRAQLRRIVKMSPSAQQAIQISAILAGQTSKPALPGATTTPEVLQPQN